MSGLSKHVAPLELARQMAENPVLRDAFKDSPLEWVVVDSRHNGHFLNLRDAWFHHQESYPAPLVGEMLAWLDVELSDDDRDVGGYEYGPPVLVDRRGNHLDVEILTDPAALARACLAAAGEGVQ